MPTPLSLQTYTVRELAKADYYGVLRQIAEIGYVAIESAPPKDKTPEEFKKFLDSIGLRLSSTWGWPTKENLSQIVDAAHLFGYRHLVNGFWIDDLKTPELIQKSGDKLKAAADLLGPHGLTFCVHNHWFEFDRIGSELVYDLLLQAAGPAVGCELDIYWASNFGTIDVPTTVSRLKARTPLLHVKDGTLVKDQPQTAVGDGKLDVKRCIDAADPDVLKYLVVELDDYAGGHANMMDAVRASYRWLTERGLGVGKS